MYKIMPKQPHVVYKHFLSKFKEEISQLYYGDMYLLSVDEEGEEFLEYLYDDIGIMKYGCKVYTEEFEDELYNVVLVNND